MNLPVNSKYFRIGVPVGLGAVITGVLLGVFLPGGEETAPAPSSEQVASSEDTTGTADSAAETAEQAATAKGAPGAEQGAAASAGAGDAATVEEEAAAQPAAADRGGGQTATADGGTADAAKAGEASAGAAATEGSAGAGTASPSGDSADMATARTATDHTAGGSAAVEEVAADSTGETAVQGAAAGDATMVTQQSVAPVYGVVSGEGGVATGRGDEQAGGAAASSSASQAASADAPPRTKPSFDVVRINPKGGTVMAGRAEPGAEVIIRDGEDELGRATANGRGEWVFTDSRPMPSGDRQLSVKDAGPGGSESENVVVVSVPEPAPGELEGDVEDQQALAVLQPRDGGPSIILQLPEEEPAAPADGAPRTAVDSVDYTSEGDITVSGQSEPGARLNVYVDNEAIATAQADEEGRWRAELGEGVSEGQHQLRVDSVDEGGKVVTRAETEIAKAPKTMLELAGETLVIVQPGNSLWRIARRTYGGGVHYTEIYQANLGQIRDPNLIYPGQIFTVPPLG